MLDVAHGSMLDSLIVEAVMVEEACILGGHDGGGQRRGNLLDGHPVVVEGHRLSCRHLLAEPDEHERREPYGHPTQHDNRKDSGGKECHHYPHKRSLDK